MKARNTAVLALMLLNTSAGVALAEEPAQKPPQQAQKEGAQSIKNLPAQEIQEVQQALRDRGMYKGAVDGIAGAGTIAALEAFQKDHGLPTDGLNKETRFELGMKQQSTVAQRPAAGMAEPTPAASAETAAPTTASSAELAKLDSTQIRELQQRLQRLGYFAGTADGKFSTATRQALSRFYRDQAELAQRGRISVPGAMALGLNPADVQPVSGSDMPEREPAPSAAQPEE